MMPTQEHLLNVNISMVCHGLMAHHLLMSNYKMSKLLFLFFILFLNINNASATDKIHLVSVGIADYPGTSNDLTLPAKDAASVKWLYEKNSNAVTTILINSAATKGSILSAIRSTFQCSSTDDIVVFFFSGHGYKGGFVAYDGYLSYEEVRQAMSITHCKNKMIFADACFSGKMRQGTTEVKQEHEKSNVMLFLSSRDNETSIERKDMKNGFFTACLVSALRGKADSNRDRTISAKELFKFVSDNVRALSKNKQHPVMWGHFSDDMPVIVW